MSHQWRPRLRWQKTFKCTIKWNVKWVFFVTFLCILNDSLNCWIILYTLMHWQLHEHVQPEVYLLVKHQVHLLRHLYVCKYWSSPLGATPELILSIFNWPDFAFICTLKSILNSILKCVPYTLLFAISVTSFGRAICDFVAYLQADCWPHS